MPGAVLLIGNYVLASERDEAASLLDELGELVATLGLRIVGRELVQHREMHARYLVGRDGNGCRTRARAALPPEAIGIGADLDSDRVSDT